MIVPSNADAPADEPTTEAVPETLDAVSNVDYTNSWRDPPPSTIVIREVVHQPTYRPYRPAPPPESDYDYEDHDDAPRVHGFVGLSLRGTTTNHNPSAFTGARVGFTFDDRFTIGGAFYSLTARYAGSIVDSRGNELGMRMAYGGVLLGWTLYQGRVTSVGLETMAGAGAACISSRERYFGRWSCIEKVGLVSIEPGVQVAFTVSDWVRLGVTGGYRFVTREAWRQPNDFTLSGPYVGLEIQFGGFRSGDDDRR